MHAISTNTPMIDMSSSQISADTLSRQTHDHSGQRPLISCHHCRHKHAVIGACSQRPADTCSRSYPVLASGASSRIVCAACPAGTYAGSAGPWQCMLEQKSIGGRHVCHVANGLLHEPHEGSGRHLQSTAVRDHGRHVMRDLRDHDTLQQIDITTTCEHKG